jgi:NhaA family Na+:H+ antiporter
MFVVAVIAWFFVHESGIHATIAGVALGLAMSPRPARRAYRMIEPFSNTIVLPLFAFAAALVPIPQVSPGELSPAFWGIAIGLPIGKIVGITTAGGIAVWASHRRGSHVLERSELLVVGALGGIGFTVSLLMNELAFARSAEIVDEGTLGVLLGSAVSILASAVLLSAASRRARTRRSPEAAPPPTR